MTAGAVTGEGAWTGTPPSPEPLPEPLPEPDGWLGFDCDCGTPPTSEPEPSVAGGPVGGGGSGASATTRAALRPASTSRGASAAESRSRSRSRSRSAREARGVGGSAGRGAVCGGSGTVAVDTRASVTSGAVVPLAASLDRSLVAQPTSDSASTANVVGTRVRMGCLLRADRPDREPDADEHEICRIDDEPMSKPSAHARRRETTSV